MSASQSANDGDVLGKRDSSPSSQFSNPAAQQFYVDGRTLPDVTFDAGPSWSGLLPISGKPDETRKLFFWFWPTTNASNSRDLLFWVNGGPGCSSLEGFLQENGPILWPWGQAHPTPNPYSWTRLANVLWIEQPAGTGFSQGDTDIHNDDELAAEVVGFMQQFLEVFSELKGSNFFLSGESYAGYYVPYIANWIYEHSSDLDLHLKGTWISDPVLSYDVVQEQIPALRFVQTNKNVFPFNSTFLSQLQSVSDACGYTDYLDKYVTYPPSGPLPLPAASNGSFDSIKPECDIQRMIMKAAATLNPAFDPYRVTDMWPLPWDVLGFPRLTQDFIYFNRSLSDAALQVQDAIHAPHINWEVCTHRPVYVNRKDLSIRSTLSVLPNVIEKSERTVIAHGLADFILMAEGARIAIQNMTWGGAQGFQTPIQDESFSVDGMGVYGNMHQERNLTYVEFYFSGHMTPQFVPWAAYQTIEYLLGKRASPSAGQ
ncbi:alpha/beta-hydrolase [Dentipellis sp. KUC8613]|nr:alpha/beta-hydrolase [Dentipellis sp. KUC8613]